jgi:hypothetical protein
LEGTKYLGKDTFSPIQIYGVTFLKHSAAFHNGRSELRWLLFGQGTGMKFQEETPAYVKVQMPKYRVVLTGCKGFDGTGAKEGHRDRLTLRITVGTGQDLRQTM